MYKLWNPFADFVTAAFLFTKVQTSLRKKKSETKLTAGVLNKRSQNTQKLKKNASLNQTKKDRLQIFEEILFSKLCTIQKQTNHLPIASWILAEGGGHKICLYVF